MNNQIKDLVKQAGLNIDGYGDPIWGCLDDADAKTQFLEKFTKLIVKKCSVLVKDQLKVIPVDQADWDGHNYGYTAAVHETLDRFKEHFGFE